MGEDIRLPLEMLVHYRVLKKLGAGGMGVVYLAEDTRLLRKVALKILPCRSGVDAEARARFQFEARAASALNHPNILTIYEVGVAGEDDFIAMEFIDGVTLRSRLSGGRLSLPAALDVGLQVATGLGAAHAAGIVHRDIKPENIMLRGDGFVKILDFGIARSVGSAPGLDDATAAISQTGPGIVLGTAKYMSPEQARGMAVDARTDVFSLGVVLHEMIGGRPPFEGQTASDTIAAVLLVEPAPLSRFVPDIPREVETLVSRALAKDRDDRTATAMELAAELKSLLRRVEAGSTQGTGTTGVVVTPGEAPPQSLSGVNYTTTKRRKAKGPVDTVAVLPLGTTGGGPESEFLADGLTDALISSLSRLPRLKVMARSTVARYVGQDAAPLTVARDLGVRAVLAGRVVHVGPALVVKAELVDAADGTQLWGGQFKKKPEDLFTLEDELSAEITEALRARLTVAEKKRVVRRTPASSEAYLAYLKGRHHWNRRTPDSIRKSIECFNEALASDPAYALAYAGLADSYFILSWFSSPVLAPSYGLARARDAALKALECDDRLAEPHATLGMVRLWLDRDPAAAEMELDAAIETNPDCVEAHHFKTILLFIRERFDEALASNRRALELEPFSLIVNTARGWMLHHRLETDNAIADLRRTLEIDSSFFTAWLVLGWACEQRGDWERAEAAFERARSVNPNPVVIASIAHCRAVSGRASEARALLRELELRSTIDYVPSECLAIVSVGLAEYDEAFRLLDRSVDELSGYTGFFRLDPRLHPLRTDVRWEPLLRRARICVC